METTTIDTAAVLDWFAPRTKAHREAGDALALLAKCIAAGEWAPRASLFVTSRLGRAQRAIEFAKRNRGALDKIGDKVGDYGLSLGFRFAQALHYGRIEDAVRLNIRELETAAEVPGPHPGAPQLAAEVRRWVDAFAPVARAVARLNATRPAPVITTLGASPTVTKTLHDAGLDARPETIRMCPIERYQVELDGKFYWMARLLWPAGTKFHTTRFGWDSFQCCHACGHRIKNAFNWVPIVIDDAAGVPHGLWTGRDCAETLFGIKVEGVLEIDTSKDAPEARP